MKIFPFDIPIKNDDDISEASSILDSENNFSLLEADVEKPKLEEKDLKNRILKDVLNQVLPDDGEYDIDGMMASKAKPSNSLLVRFLKIIGLLDLDLHEAVLTGSLYHVQRSVRKILYGKKPNPLLINQLDEAGRTALSIAAKIKNEKIVEYLLENGALPDIADESTGRTPLMFAVLNKDHEMTKKLVSSGSSVNFADFQSITPLMLAASVNDLMSCKIICSKRVLVNAQDLNGWTALHYCACFNSPEVLRYLIVEEAADRTIRDLNRRRAVDIAKFKDHGECVSILSTTKRHLL